MSRGCFGIGLFRMGLFWFGAVLTWDCFGLGLFWFGAVSVGLFWLGRFRLGRFHTVALNNTFINIISCKLSFQSFRLVSGSLHRNLSVILSNHGRYLSG